MLYEVKDYITRSKVSNRQMVNNTVQFFSKDARETFLEPKSVDLFLIHPPFLSMINESYGGDQDIQLHKIKNKEEFRTSMITILKNMEQALSDDGSILFILPNFHRPIETISDIVKYTDLTIYNILLWDFEKNKTETNRYYTNLILHIRKNTKFEYPGEKLDKLFIEEPWVTCDNAFPISLADMLIKSFSKEGDTVADIFGGTGTTIISALKNNRKAIYSDASEVQLEIAKRRVSDIIKESEPTIQKETKMTKEEAVAIMLESINSDNLALGLQSGLNEAELKTQIEQSQQSLNFMMSNIYDKLKEAGAVA
jgi:DNA modification methylase